MTWSSQQVIDKKDLVYLQKDLLALYTMLQKQQHNTMGIMTDMSGHMTPDTTMTNTLESILINLENE